uniref:Coiled-coil domain-containing protein 116 n=1 Tax=Catagonus wagneri TaxID=51154 RepID=A0A8C3W4C9_9CETA
MTSCRHHSGYLADDEAGPTTYFPRPPKKPPSLGMGPASKVGHIPHPPSIHGPVSSSRFHGQRQNLKGPPPFRSFLDFLVKGQVLDSLQTVVEAATERMATMKTGAGLPLVEMQDPVEVPKAGRRARGRPSFSTVHRHRTRPSLCVGYPNNYPSCSSSMSDSHSSFRACWPGSQCQDSDLGTRNLGPLPAMKDRLLLEKSLKRLLQLENRGKGLGQSCSHRDSLPWNSLDSQASSQWTPETSWFSGLLGSSSGTLEASELGSGERQLFFLKQKFDKQIKSLLSQPAAFDLPGYCAIREPHRTLDFLAEHHLFPALQNVVNQAVDKLSGACRHNGCPLFPSEWEPTPESNSKMATPTNGEEPGNLLHTTASSPKVDHRKNIKSKGHSKPKEGGSPVSSTQVDTRFQLEVTPTEEPKVPSPHPRHEVPDRDPKVRRPPTLASGSLSSSQRPRPWRSLHLTLPGPGVVLEVFIQFPLPFLLLSPPCILTRHLRAEGLSPLPATLRPEVTSSRLGLGVLGLGLQWKGSYSHCS